MKLVDMFAAVPGAELGAPSQTEVTSLAYDSRCAITGVLFFAIRGEKTDGHQYIEKALAQGAVAIVSEQPAPPNLASRWVRVPKIRRALSEAARAFLGRPDSRLQLVGITGTNGKTTTAYLLESIFNAAGIPVGLFGTVEYRFARRSVTAGNTTPESLDLLQYFAELARAGGQAAIMEVSSHALAQERVWAFHFAAAVFTNLTQDHLDYHQTMENYFLAKRRLFDGLGTSHPELAVLNADDPYSTRLMDLPYAHRITYGSNSNAQVKAKKFVQSAEGIRASIVLPNGRIEIQSPLIGRANLMNILAAAATATGLDIPADKIEAGIGALRLVPGRMERVDLGQPFLVLVDYAHTDDALRNILRPARELARNRLIVVFGCGGDRDRAKRPLMGEAAGSLSDLVVLTSDNPRSEDPLLIMNDVMVGLQKTGKPYLAEVDREKAIRKAIGLAHAGDVVVLAGKGHETYQVLRDRTIHFDDHEVARQVLRELGYEGKPPDKKA